MSNLLAYSLQRNNAFTDAKLLTEHCHPHTLRCHLCALVARALQTLSPAYWRQFWDKKAIRKYVMDWHSISFTTNL